MMKWTYQIYELSFQSDFEIPNLNPSSIPSIEKPDVLIHNMERKAFVLSDVSYHQDWDEMEYHIGKIEGRPATLMDFKDLVKYWIIDGAEIWVDRQPNAHEPTVQSYLCNLAFANILLQREGFIFHASSIVLPEGGAIVFSGESGAGKTTLTAGFAKEGYQILAEDLTLIQYRNGKPYVLPGIPYLKLGTETAELMGLAWENLPALYDDDLKRAHLLDQQYCKRAEPLFAIHLIGKDEIQAIEQRELVDFQAKLNFLVDNIHYQGFFMGYPLDEVYTQIAVQLAQDIPFQLLTRPAGKNTLKEMMQILV